MVAWAETARRLERWLLPAECVTCAAPITTARESLVCAVCRLRWRVVEAPNCARCGESLPLGLGCRICIDWPPDLGPVRSAVQLDAITRPLVHRFKYQGWWRLSADFAVRMAPMLAQLGPGDLVPVPLGRARQRQRGFNQAEALASALAALSGRAVRPERLARMRETPSQTRLTPEERRANLSEAFQAGSVSHVPVILVDDVFTTGATLCSAAEALLDAGVPQVAAITFARAGLPLAGEPRRL